MGGTVKRTDLVFGALLAVGASGCNTLDAAFSNVATPFGVLNLEGVSKSSGYQGVGANDLMNVLRERGVTVVQIPFKVDGSTLNPDGRDQVKYISNVLDSEESWRLQVTASDQVRTAAIIEALQVRGVKPGRVKAKLVAEGGPRGDDVILAKVP